MQPIDNFLNAVESRLRCPAERRPGVREELRGHLVDRVEALTGQGANQEEAEKQAVREMEPAWLLALRLSKANGWNVRIQVLRELWALGLGFLALSLAGNPLGNFHGLLIAVSTGNVPPNIKIAWFLPDIVGFFVSLIAGLAFAFSLGRIVRGWIWAWGIGIICVLATTPFLGYLRSNALWLALTLLVEATFILAAFLGQRKQSPRLAWLGWVSAALLVLSLFGLCLAHAHGDVASALGAFQRSSPYRLWPVAAISWVFWLAAWVIERAGRTPKVDVVG
jgi:hypothetical protein